MKKIIVLLTMSMPAMNLGMVCLEWSLLKSFTLAVFVFSMLAGIYIATDHTQP